MATVNPDDLFAVNRDDITYSVEQQNLMASLENTDYLAVNRDDVTYKITGQEFIESIIDPLALSPRVTPEAPLTGELLTVDPNVFGGKSPFVYSYQWKYKTTEDGAVVDFVGETGTTYLTSGTDEGYYIACEVTVTDSLGTTVTELSNFTEPVSVPSIVVKPSIIAPSDGAGELVSAESDEIIGRSDGSIAITKVVFSGGAGQTDDVAYGYGYQIGGQPIAESDMFFDYTGVQVGQTIAIVCSNYPENGTGIDVTGDCQEAGTFITHPAPGTVASVTLQFTATEINGRVGLFLNGDGTSANQNQYNFNRQSVAVAPPTTLTLAGDKDLTVFAALDDVQQDSGHTPTSSLITDVDDAPTARLFRSLTAPANLAEVLTMTELTYPSQEAFVQNEYLIVVPSSNVTGQAFDANGTGGFNYHNPGAQGGGHFDANGQALGGTGSYNQAEWVLQNYTTDPTEITTAYKIPSWTGGYTVFQHGVGTNGVVSQVVGLTLTDDTDLANFRVGDVVQGKLNSNALPGDTVEFRYGATAGANWDEGTFAETLTLFNNQTFSMSVYAFLYKFNEPKFNLEFMRPAGELTDHSNGWILLGSNDGNNWTELKNVDSINSPTSTRDPILVTGETPYIYFRVNHYIKATGAETTMSVPNYRWGVYDDNEEVKITAITEAPPTITVDGGNWSTTAFDTTNAAIINEWIINTEYTSTTNAKDLTYDVDTSGDIELAQDTTLVTKGGLIEATCDKTFNTYYSNDGTNWIIIDIGASGGTVVNYTGHPYYAMNPQQFQDSFLECKSLITSSYNQVTGPATTPATGTVASTNPAANTMTLSVSDETFPKRWIVNQGKFVKGEEKLSPDEPVDISGMIDVTPNTDEIVNRLAETNTYSSNVTTNYAFASGQGPELAFDGDPNTLCQLDTSTDGSKITWDASSYNLSTANNNIVVRSATITNVWKITGTTGVQTVQSVSDPAGKALPDVGILQTLEVLSQIPSTGTPSLMYVKSGGVILTDGDASTTLTLSGAKDLELLEGSDAVAQDSGHTPTSSLITDVDSNPVWSDYLLTNGSIPITNGTGFHAFEPRSTPPPSDPLVGTTAGWATTENPVTFTPPSQLSTSSKITVYAGNRSNVAETNLITVTYGDDTTDTFTTTSGASFWCEPVEFNTGGKAVKSIKFDATNNGLFAALYIDDVLLVDGLTTLTFDPAADNTDLANFRVGDVVTGASAGVSITESNVVTMYDDAATAVSNPSPDEISSKLSNYSYFNADLNDANKQGNKGLYMYGSASITFTYSGHTPGDTIDIVAGSASTNNNAGNQRFTVSGDVQEDSTDVIFVPSTESSKTVLPKQLTQLTTTASSGTVTLTVGLADSNAGSQIFLHYIQGLAGAVNITNINSSTPSITVNGGTWTNGDVVTGPATTPATGVFASTDGVNTMTLSASDETYPKRWIVNQGKYVVGPDKTTEGFLHLYSSEFASDPADVLAHTTSDWQITLKTDTTYSSPVDETSFNSNNLTSWPPTNLEGGESYRCRVRHRSQEIQSEWSDDVTFMTASDVFETAKPGTLLYSYAPGDDFAPIATDSGVKVLNAAISGGTIFAVGTDGKLYGEKYDAPNLKPVTDYASFESDVIQVSCNYNANLSTAKYYVQVLHNDGTIYSYYIDNNGNGQPATNAPLNATSVFTFGSVTQLTGTIAEGKLYAMMSQNNAERRVGTEAPVGYGEWTEVPITIPGGRELKSVCGSGGGSYDAPNMLILATDGTLWHSQGENTAGKVVPGLPSGGTNTAPIQVAVGKTFSEIITTGSCYEGSNAVSALETTGQLWYGATASESVTGADIAFGPLAGETDWQSALLGGYTTKTVWGLKKDGFVYQAAPGSSIVFNKINGQSNPVSKLGGMRQGGNSTSTLAIVIHPD